MPDTLLMQGHLKNRLLASLPSEMLGLMANELRQIYLSQGAVIWEPGDPVDNIYFPQTGLISILVVTKNGSPIEISTIGRNGALGLHRGFGRRRAFTRATTQIAGKFFAIRANCFEQFAQQHVVLRDLITRHLELLWAATQQIAACNAVHDAPSRLARCLLDCADGIGSEQLFLTQGFIAQMLSVRRTTVTLMARALQQKGLIRYSRGRITILERENLKACACECYAITRYDNLALAMGLNDRAF